MVKRSRESSVLSTDSDGESAFAAEGESPRPSKLNAAMLDTPSVQPVMQCSLPPHRDGLDFASIEAFEVHYTQCHSNRCASCGKNFPTAHFLALHIDENHNAFREALQGRGEKTFACFVEGCDKMCSTPQKRRLHLIDKHLFPKLYNFRIVDTGIDKSTSMLQDGRRRRVSTSTDPAVSGGHRRKRSEVEILHVPATVPQVQFKETPRDKEHELLSSKPDVSDAAIKDLESSMSTLRFVPPQVKQRSKQGFV
jgi:hypothetical protein